MPQYNHAIAKLDMPARFRKLPVDERGYPVPKFVGWVDGKPDFRTADASHTARCIGQKVCWLCGEQLGNFKAFVIGPMCAINRVTSEPPSHLDCARFAVQACPFMVNPQRKRNPHDMPEEGVAPAGIHLDRNPGASLIWVTKAYELFRAPNGLLIRIGDPISTAWYCKGRIATRDEIMASIESGLPKLRELAALEGGGAPAELERMITRGLALVPTSEQGEAT